MILEEYKDELKNKIISALAEFNGSYRKVSEKLGNVSNDIIRNVDIIHNKRYNYTEEGMGKPELRRYLVGRRNRFYTPEWNNKDPKIAKARQLYDDGKVEIVQALDGFHVLLYAIPRRVVDTKRKPYFSYIEDEKFKDVPEIQIEEDYEE